MATENDKKQIYISKVNSKFNVTSFKYKFDESEKELVQLHQALSNVVDSNKNDIINSFMRAVEEKVSQLLISNFNITRFNYEKFFPKKA